MVGKSTFNHRRTRRVFETFSKSHRLSAVREWRWRHGSLRDSTCFLPRTMLRSQRRCCRIATFGAIGSLNALADCRLLGVAAHDPHVALEFEGP